MFRSLLRPRLLGSAAAAAGFAAAATHVAHSAANDVDKQQVEYAVRDALINQKVNACPMAVRVAWHASGTYDKNDKTGGSNGGGMRFEPERSDPANAGLFIIHDLLERVKQKFPSVSYADLWTLAGCKAVEYMGGPKVPHSFGRADASNGDACPAHGRLPDALQGASHLRDVFYRMGFNDRDIVALSGGHTVGRCHFVRSGFDGPWTRSPLKFDNEYFRNLLSEEWVPRKWHGNKQYTDKATGTLTMLPSDVCLLSDPEFRKYVELYAHDQQAFFADFSSAFSRLVSLGCPDACAPTPMPVTKFCPKASAEFREMAMHGSLEHMAAVAAKANVDARSFDGDSGRTALHKAAFWGHVHVVKTLLGKYAVPVEVADYAGDTPLHDAARFGHTEIVRLLLEAGSDPHRGNKDHLTPLDLAEEHGKRDIAAIIKEQIKADIATASAMRRKSYAGTK